ncbi:flagellar hook protein FlgE [Plastorhodobacter daqingensis]|uniref:Flagellar hook protein FlgE n=1 Tax=Plastorhodobacter daqingensis TaxID=1387281 RepID=A0ABW2UF04_9RHOB
MTISSSLNAGVAGLNANAARLAAISDNIANSATYGYRRATTDFHAMVINSGTGGYTAGGVAVTSSRLVDRGGSLISTTNATDLAIAGRGMLPVTSYAAVNNMSGNYPLMLMPTGSFRPDAEGVLRTDTGLVLLGWPLDSDGALPQVPRDTSAALMPVRVAMNEYAGAPTTRVEVGVNLPATSTIAGAAGQIEGLAVEYFGNLGNSEALSISYEPTVPATGSSNTWTMTIRDSASGGAIVGEFTLTFDDTRGGGGRLDSVTALSGGTYDAATGELVINVAGGPMNLAIGRIGQTGGMSQLGDSFAPLIIAKDGYAVGTLTGVEVNDSGIVYALYSNGSSRPIFQVPVADVPNPNGLRAVDGGAFTVTNASGGFYLWDAGDGPTGSMRGYARQESATDVAGELTQLIQTQRAYSSNAKVIQTVDEMLQETTNIKR